MLTSTFLTINTLSTQLLLSRSYFFRISNYSKHVFLRSWQFVWAANFFRRNTFLVAYFFYYFYFFNSYFSWIASSANFAGFFVIDRVFFWVISDRVLFRVLNEKVVVRIVSSRVPFWFSVIRSSLGSSVIMSSLRSSVIGSYLQSTVIRPSTNSWVLGSSLVPSFLFFGMSV